mmetsp:Transcript_5224/g.19527  ORF Transcript_5224/g.19527 Transcript_5224/m.19527 type:complete len:210 (-) Transcript_5224:1229-1858(-)
MVLKPGAAACRVGVMVEAGAQFIALAFELRRDIVADDEGQRREHGGQAGQQAQRPRRPEAAGAQDGELAALGQAGERDDGADQHGDREELVEVPRQSHGRQQCGLAGAGTDARHAFKVVDEVEEEEQRQKGQRDQHHRTDDVLVQQTADGFHAGALRSARRRQKRLPLSRSQIAASARNRALPCRAVIARSMPAWPLATQVCDSTMSWK